MIQWQFSTHTEKNKTWYLTALIVVLALIVYGIVNHLYMMSFVVLLFAGVYLLHETNSDPITAVQVTDHGIQVQGSWYDFGKIRDFAILYDDHTAKILRLTMTTGVTSSIDIPMTSDVNPAELRNFLLQYLTENEKAILTKSDRLIQAMKL